MINIIALLPSYSSEYENIENCEKNHWDETHYKEVSKLKENFATKMKLFI